jgi:hypothetical protein
MARRSVAITDCLPFPAGGAWCSARPPVATRLRPLATPSARSSESSPRPRHDDGSRRRPTIRRVPRSIAARPCQIASNSDPLFAFNLDPLVMACAGSPQGGPARRGVPIARLTQRRAGGSCGPTGASRQRIARSVPAEAARRDDCLKFGEIQVADCLQCFG